MLDKYLKIDETHAEISKEFTKDRCGVKKNEEKSFAYINRINFGKNGKCRCGQSTNRQIIFYELDGQ